jgi:GntR family transcriptional regulator, transcriptional repressor for pyruvate dehydrogenase complex
MVTSTVTAVREMLNFPAFVPGGKLPSEVSMAARIGVSRPVLRQALSVLKQEGVIESTRGSGTFLRGGRSSAIGAPESIAELEHCMSFRMIVECAAAAAAALHADAADIKEIQATVEALETKPPREHKVVEADLAFHLAISRATHNRYYVMTLEILQSHILLALKMARQLQSIPLSAASRRVGLEHRAILHAIKRRDQDLAAERMREHLSAGIERMFGGRGW